MRSLKNRLDRGTFENPIDISDDEKDDFAMSSDNLKTKRNSFSAQDICETQLSAADANEINENCATGMGGWSAVSIYLN